MTDQEIKAAADGLGITAKELTDAASRLGLELGVNDLSTCVKLLRGQFDANRRQKALGRINKPGLTLKQMREELEKLERALHKIAADRGTTEAAHKSIEAALKEIPPKALEIFDSLDPQLEAMPYDPKETAFSKELKRLQNMSVPTKQATAQRLVTLVTACLEDMKTPGKGNARKQAKQYVAGVQCLMMHFREALPDRQLNENDDSAFSRYVALWIQQQTDDKLESPRRHIEAAKADLEHWEKISL